MWIGEIMSATWVNNMYDFITCPRQLLLLLAVLSRTFNGIKFGIYQSISLNLANTIVGLFLRQIHILFTSSLVHLLSTNTEV